MPKPSGAASVWRRTDAGQKVPRLAGDGGFALARAGRSGALAGHRSRVELRGTDRAPALSTRCLQAPVDRGRRASARPVGRSRLQGSLGAPWREAGRVGDEVFVGALEAATDRAGPRISSGKMAAFQGESSPTSENPGWGTTCGTWKVVCAGR